MGNFNSRDRDPKIPPPGSLPPRAASPGNSGALAQKPRGSNAPAAPAQLPKGGGQTPAKDDLPAGRIVHDERGNAVWDWLKQTGRSAIESTSRLLRRLEMPELKMEDAKDEGLRLESDRDAGGGYDPYNQSAGPRRSGRK